MIRKHIRHVPDDKDNDRRAIAPYNFIELPDQVIKAQLEENGKLRDNDRYYLDRHTGRIECTLTTSSPLYTRCGLTPEQFRAKKEAKDIPEFFYTEIDPVTQKPIPAISGSSIRGMLRSLLEIASFSKVELVTKNKLFYRSLGDPALKTVYMSNFVEDCGQVQHYPNPRASCYRSKVRAGFLKNRHNRFFIEECRYGRIDRQPSNRVIPSIPNRNIYQGKSPSKTPNWAYQHQTIYVQMDQQEQDYFFRRQANRNGRQRHPDLYLCFRRVHSASFHSAPNTQSATLVITGDMQHKHLEFAFLHEIIQEYEVPEEMLQRFHDDDQITKWQEEAFEKNNPISNCRKKDGYFLKDEYLKNEEYREPVFFLLEDDYRTIRFLGRAQMFRLPYSLSPFEFIPEELHKASNLDISDAIFGFVRREKQPEKLEQSRAGRVFISDAKYKTDENGIWYEGNQDNTVIPQILASPKPTTFQHYLVQPKETNAENKNLKHYASKPVEETVIRGHKLYWHKGSDPNFEHPNPDNASDTQTTKIKPINKGVTFEFTIHFENLSDVELGALMWVLDIAQDDNYRLKLGMGKPLGMGAVKIEPKLYLSDRTKRYTQLFNSNVDNWETGEPEESLSDSSKYRSAFENYTLSQLQQEGLYQDIQNFNKIRRIQMLLAMLRWEETPSPEQIDQRQYMELDSFRDRKVLPTPLQIMGIELECNHSSSLQKNSQHSGSHRHLEKITRKQPSQQFSEGQEVDAKVIDIQEDEKQKGNKKQLTTTITYEVKGSDCPSKQVFDKQKVSLVIGDVVKVSIVKVQGTSIRKVKWVESN